METTDGRGHGERWEIENRPGVGGESGEFLGMEADDETGGLCSLGKDSWSAAYFSLQKGPGAAQAASPPEGLELINLMDQVEDFVDTGAILSNLDLLDQRGYERGASGGGSGAAGLDLFAILPGLARWMMDRTDSPWYPTMRLFRQKRLLDWESVVQEVCGALQEWIRAQALAAEAAL